jgi:hypothetical protein
LSTPVAAEWLCSAQAEIELGRKDDALEVWDVDRQGLLATLLLAATFIH